MRPTSERQSALRAPLNAILATEVNVRLVRELSLSSEWIGVGALARRTRLDRTGIYRALDRLFATGIIEFDGGDGARRCRLCRGHPLAPALSDLFRSERARFERILEGLRNAVDDLRPPPISAWVEGPVASEEDDFGDPLVVGLLDSSSRLDPHVQELARRFVDLQRELDVTVEVHGRTRADLSHLSTDERERLSVARPLLGPSIGALIAPDSASPDEPPRSHADIDARALEYGRAIADRLPSDPRLIERAAEWVRERLSEVSSDDERDLREWLGILESTTPARLAPLLRDEGERATRLRQSNPFLPILTAEEKADLEGGA